MEVLLHDSTICRLCSEENTNGIYIYADNENDQSLSSYINKYLPLKVSNDSKLPCTICPGCNIQLEATMQFLELIIAGQERLRVLYKNQQEELRRIQREANLSKEVRPEGQHYEGIVQAIIVNESGENDEILVKILPDGSLYAPEHKIALKAEGLEKPRRKRGRPPKPPVQLQETVEETPEIHVDDAKDESKDEQEDDEIDADGRRKRKRKVPTRFKEAVQGKELERIFREEGVIDENESSNDGDDSPDVEPDSTSKTAADDSEVIGRLESHEGRDLGELVIVNRQRNRGRPRGRKRRQKFMCEVCGRGFLHFGRYTIHKAIHKGVRYECIGCQTRFETRDELSKHQREKDHSGEGIVEGLNDEVRRDTAREHREEPPDWNKIPCAQCDKSFMTKQSYEVHLKAIHEGRKPFNCELCGKSFAYVTSLKGHLMSHEVKTEKGYPCDVCGKVLNHPSSVIYHKQSEHNNGRRFVCNKCDKSFKHKQLLQRHQLVHSDKRPYECNSCGAQFKAKSNLLNHQLTHTGVKKYFCEQCGQQFAHKTSLTLHYRWHSGQKPYKCAYCSKQFSQKGNLQEHVRIHTGVKPFCCEQCGRAFTTSSQFRLHVKRHTGERPWSCTFCGKRFLHKDTWKCHTRRHLGERPYECVTCHRGFTEHWALKKHMRLHTGEKPYVCNICDKAFSDCSNLSKHKKIHAGRSSKTMLWESLAASAASTVGDNDTATLFKSENVDEASTEGLEHIFYVTYQDPDEPSESKTLHIVDELSRPQMERATLQKNLNEVDREEMVTNTDSNASNSDTNTNRNNEMNLPEGQLQVTDEDGNPIDFTTKEGHRLRVTTYDGEHLQVMTPDGVTVPIELDLGDGQMLSVKQNGNGRKYSIPATNDDYIVSGNDEMEVSVEKRNEFGDKTSEEEEALDTEHTIEFMTQDGQKVQLITYEGLDTEYLTIV